MWTRIIARNNGKFKHLLSKLLKTMWNSQKQSLDNVIQSIDCFVNRCFQGTFLMYFCYKIPGFDGRTHLHLHGTLLNNNHPSTGTCNHIQCTFLQVMSSFSNIWTHTLHCDVDHTINVLHWHYIITKKRAMVVLGQKQFLTGDTHIPMAVRYHVMNKRTQGHTPACTQTQEGNKKSAAKHKIYATFVT